MPRSTWPEQHWIAAPAGAESEACDSYEQPVPRPDLQRRLPDPEPVRRWPPAWTSASPPRDGSGTTIPLVVANMTAVAGRRMAETVARRGGMAVLPQDIPVDVVAEVIVLGEEPRPGASTRRSRSARTTPPATRSACCPSGRTAPSIVVDTGRPVGVVTEADCAGVDRFTQLAPGDVRRPADPHRRAPTRSRRSSLLHGGRHRLAPWSTRTAGCVGILTRTGALRADAVPARRRRRGRLRIAAALGINGDVRPRPSCCWTPASDLLVVDTAHGHQEKMLQALRAVRDARARRSRSSPATSSPAEGVTDLVEAGADIVKVGVGPGAMCTTRMMTGGRAGRSSARCWNAPPRPASSARTSGPTAACGTRATSRSRWRPAPPT